MNIPKGWKLVPEFPSIDMIKAGSASIDDNGGNARWADIREAWADMLSAAPTPPAQDDEVLEVLRELVAALENAFISSWQSTAAWQAQLDAASALLTKRGTA
jgi:lipase chaperone LimK